MDLTSLVVEGQQARAVMQEAKRRNKATVKAKYEARMRAEIAELNAEVEHTFAKTLERLNENGLTQALIRREILRTNVWSTWTYWRDMAGIAPERVSARLAREAAEAEVSEAVWYREEDGKWFAVGGVVPGTDKYVRFEDPFEIRYDGYDGAEFVDESWPGLEGFAGYNTYILILVNQMETNGDWDRFVKETK